jgi:hypothetical protein
LKGRPFDWNFDLNEDGRIYCTELLYVVLKKTAPEITLRLIKIDALDKMILPLDSCYDSEYFTEIIEAFPRCQILGKLP